MKVYILLLALISTAFRVYATDYYSTSTGFIINSAGWATESGGSGTTKSSFNSDDNLFIESGHTILLPSTSGVTLNTITVLSGGTLQGFKTSNMTITIKNLVVVGTFTIPLEFISNCTINVENIYFIGSNYSFTRSETTTTINHTGLLYASTQGSQTPPSDVTGITGDGQLEEYMSSSAAKGTLHPAASTSEGTLEDLPSTFSSETGGITLASGYTLKINNSTLGANFTITAGTNTDIEFLGTSIGTFTPSGTFRNITMNTSNNITLGASLQISNQLTLTSGIINTTDDYSVSVAGTINGASYNSNPDNVITGGSNSSHVNGALTVQVTATSDYVLLPVGDQGRLRVAGVRNLVGSPSNYILTVRYNQAVHDDAADVVDAGVDLSTVEYWDIQVTGADVDNTNEHFNVVLTYDDFSNVNTGSLSTLHVMHYRGSSWNSEGNGDGGGATNTASPNTNIDNVNGFFEAPTATFSPFSLGGGGGQNLPVELTSFDATQDNSEMIFSWETAQEINNDFFELEGSNDKRNTNTIAKIEGAGNSQTERLYTYRASTSEWNLYRYFRLKQTDFDGTYSYSDWIEVNNTVDVDFDFVVYPNPAHLNLNVNTFLGNNDKINTYQITDLQGRILEQKEWNNMENIDISFLNNGLYLITLTTESGKKKIHRFTVQ